MCPVPGHFAYVVQTCVIFALVGSCENEKLKSPVDVLLELCIMGC